MTTDEAIAAAESEGFCLRFLMNQSLRPDSTNWFVTLDGGAYLTAEGYHRRIIKTGIGTSPVLAILTALTADPKMDEVPSTKYIATEPKLTLSTLGLTKPQPPINRRA